VAGVAHVLQGFHRSHDEVDCDSADVAVNEAALEALVASVVMEVNVLTFLLNNSKIETKLLFKFA
jgi:hypothetical protein